MHENRGKQDFSPKELRLKRKCRRIRLFLGLSLLIVLSLLILADVYVGSFSKGRLYQKAEDVPYRRAAVVLGCNKYAYGRLNLYYQHRIQAAVELWEAGKIDAILVSGDNSRKEYDEPGSMKADLVEKGIPAEYIALDYAGFRTLDSMIRAKEVFGLDEYIVVSQPFHCQRAIYLAGRKGQSVIGYAAVNPTGVLTIKVRLREVFARFAAVLDIIISRTTKFLGPRETIRYRNSNKSDEQSH
jgi:SanA protein